jgi:hypothetical protein
VKNSGPRLAPGQKTQLKAAAKRERVLREAGELGMRLAENTDSGVVEYETKEPSPSLAPTLALHPLCALFPRLEGAKRDELVEDIRRHGQLEPGTLYEGKILDGANRFYACMATDRKFRARQYDGDDPLGFVLAQNYRRRHLTAAQRRQFRQGVIKLHPKMSDRVIGELLGVDGKTIAADRAALGGTAENSAVEKRIGRDGKARRRPAPKPRQPVGPSRQITYVPPAPEPPPTVRNQPEISADVDLTDTAERLAEIPDDPRDETGCNLGFALPNASASIADRLYRKFGPEKFLAVLGAMQRLADHPAHRGDFAPFRKTIQ